MQIESELALGLALPTGVFVYLCWTIDEPGAKHWAFAALALWLAAMGGSLEAASARTLALCFGCDVSILTLIGCRRFVRHSVSPRLVTALWAVPATIALVAAFSDLPTAFGVTFFVDSGFYVAIVGTLWPLRRTGISQSERLLPLVFGVMLVANAVDLSLRATQSDTTHSAVAMGGAATAIGLTQLFALVQRILERERSARNRIEDEVAARTRQLADAQSELRHRERLASIGTLAAGVAHQLNNPIGAILLAAEATDRETASGDTEVLRPREIRTIREQAERCRRIVRGIMRFARAEPSTKSRCDLVEIIETAMGQVEVYAKDAGARLRLEHDGDAPIVASPADLEEVFVNVLRNAIESKDEGASVRVLLDRSATEYVVSIADDGRGIEPDVLDRIVEPFFSTRIRSGGTGLGLSVAHGVVESHGGTLEIASELGIGTTVTIRLPR